MGQIHPYTFDVNPAGPMETRQARNEDTGNIGGALQQVGMQVENTAALIDRRQGQAEVSDIAAKVAQAHADLTNDLDDTLKTSDPGDKNVSSDFMERVNDQLNDIGEGIKTRAGRDYFQKARAMASSHFQAAAYTGQANLAGEKAKQDLENSVNSLSSSAFSDPSSFEGNKALLSLQMNAIQDSGVIGAKQRAELEMQGQKELAKSAIKGWIHLSPEQAKSQLDSGRWDGYINGDTKAQMYGEVTQAQNAERIEKMRQDKVQQDALASVQDARQSAYLSGIYAGKTGTRDILGDRTLDFSQKEQMLNILDKHNRDEVKPDQGTVISAFNRIHLPDGDPNKITDRSQLQSMFPKLGFQALNQLTTELSGMKTEEGKMQSSFQHQQLKGIQDTFIKKDAMGIPDPDGERRYSEWYNNAYLPALEAQKKSGKPISNLYDSSKPEYIGNTTRAFMGSLRDKMEAMTRNMNTDAPSAEPPQKGALTPGAAAPAPGLVPITKPGVEPRLQGESPSDYLKRTGKK